jgi:hypothetical protein
MTEMMKLIQEGVSGGWLLATEGCLPSAKGAEAKELVGGLAILKANSYLSTTTPSTRSWNAA